jgi:hypothetical protein
MIAGEGGAVMTALMAVSILVAAGVLSGCGSMRYTKAGLDGRIVCDADRMDRIERAARREHKQVRWPSCPLATLRVVS